MSIIKSGVLISWNNILKADFLILGNLLLIYFAKKTMGVGENTMI
ncbi:hypothetical protein SAMN04487920_11347 [Bacillus mycoides]|jgi:hypothetical protein|uniref:Uncharacterized protein n=1 Tax=Bacillus mycoides TaxID=1405 RepID=A0AAP8H0K8_BACMY|nr:hypothetical protein S2E19_01926 [Bacillus mycoides]PJN60471.1 hypothetical protein BAWEI_43010 [Bacillus mycoides]PJN72023.1 hypothetical protein BACWE_10480 [Bacillus mycoides]SFQ87336.1 hypothetical protein SAMN04487920_11347 [Bacillus mycoides]